MKTILLLTALFLSMIGTAQTVDFELSPQEFEQLIGSVAAGNLNGNGTADLILDGQVDLSGPHHSLLYSNDGEGNFTESSPFEVDKSGVIVADFDNDGIDDQLSLVALDDDSIPVVFFQKSNGDGTFTDITNHPFLPSFLVQGVAFDMDNDGDLDLFIQAGLEPNGRYTHLYENHGNMDFELVQTFTETRNGDVFAGDIDNNGWIDIVRVGDSGSRSAFIMWNNNGVLTEEVATDIHVMADGSIMLIDMDNDGFPDYAGAGNFSSAGYGVEFRINDGTGNFPTSISSPFPPIRGVTFLVFDVDNDGIDDFFVSGRQNNGQNIARIYRNNGNGTFTVVKSFEGFWGGGAVAVDVNDDGLLDLFMSGNTGGPFPFEQPGTWLYINTTSFMVTTSSSPVEGGTTTGGGNLVPGSDITVLATANTGYQFLHWTEDGDVVSTEEEYSFVVNDDRDLTAVFEVDMSVNDNTLATVTLYPNPVKNLLSIDVPNGAVIKRSEVYSITGRLMGSYTDVTEISFTEYPTGMYFVKLFSNTSQVIKKVIKQ